MEVLVVGAGAVGQVYARHLARGGARVSLLVKEKHAESARAGFTMYPIRGRKREPVTFVPDAVLTSVEEASSRRFDQVWLCVPSHALEGPWIDSLASAVGDALVVYLQPGMHVRERMRALVPTERLVDGAIALVSYPAPLRGETVPRPGTAYLFPPGNKTRFSGERAREAADALGRGGCPAGVSRDARRFLSATSAVLQPMMVALEGAGWSFAQLSRGPLLSLGLRAARQAVAVAAAEVGFGAPWWRVLLRPIFARVGLWLAPRFAPFPLEAYLELHFTKVGGQTRLLFPRYAAAGPTHGLPVDALQALADRVLTGGD